MAGKIVIIDKTDIERAKFLRRKEVLEEVTESSAYAAGVYCILSVAESNKKVNALMGSLNDAGLLAPEAVLGSTKRLEGLMSYIRFPNKKYNSVMSFTRWWKESEVPKQLLSDIEEGRRNELELRRLISGQRVGLGYKGASFFMVKLGYENVVPIDIWMLRFLDDCGYQIIIPDYGAIGGLTGKRYMQYESLISDMAIERGMTPAFFQFVIWTKYSGYKPQTDLYQYDARTA